MSYLTPKRPLPASSEEPDADFSWPPTDEELAQYVIKIPASPGSASEVLPETLAPLPAPAIAQAATAPSSSKPEYAEFDGPLGDEGQTRRCAEDPSISRVAVAQNERALDGASPGEWVAEIARLQELIDGLTQKLEWRIEHRHITEIRHA